jgi:2-methylcitrate dehydratase PrpD
MTFDSQNNLSSISEDYAEFISNISFDELPEKAKEIAINDLIDMSGLCIATRNENYIQMLIEGWHSKGICTALGHERTFDMAGAAMINGTATHGEDFDDTLEGAPIRVGAMVIPAILAVCERFRLSGKDLLLGITVGLETICRMNHVVAGKIHQQCFHPVGVIGPFGSAIGVCKALGLNKEQITNAMGIAASFSSGIIEYLTDGAWTKRLHPGWAAQSGIRAALIAKQGFNGPRTVFEGEHNFFRAFAPKATPKYEYLKNGLGKKWMMENIVFKPYACGTMIHPYIDCMIRLSDKGVDPEEIVEIECKTGEGLVHRLWEPLANKQTPQSGYAAKFSMPWCMALGFYERDAGLKQFTDEKVKDPKILKLSSKIHYVIDPENEYPDNYTGHIKVKFKDRTIEEIEQDHMRGGVKEPLSREELIKKFKSNTNYGNWSNEKSEKLLNFCINLEKYDDLSILTELRR